VRGRVIILSVPQDTHAHAMCEAIERKGGEVSIYYTTDFPERLGLTIRPSRRSAALAAHDPSRMELGAQCSSVWLRRTLFAAAPASFEESDRAIIERECRQMRRSFLDLLCPSAFWVNPLHREEPSKPAQLVAALQCGFQVPRTLASNDPGEILAFVRAAPGRVVFKTFSSLAPTTVITDEILAEPELLRWTPGIYQHYVDKAYEMRVTVIGDRVFAVRINSQATTRGKIDWREAQRSPGGRPGDLTLEAVGLSRSVEDCCRRVLRSLGLAFGTIDLIVTPTKKHVFLEVNSSGQFLFVEAATGLPHLDALSEMLLEGRTDYAWDPDSPSVRFDADFEKAVEVRQAMAIAEHVPDLQR
jgi:glutathione synthase/RimK-type ligase-like ATP-grasp enzyme